VAIVLLLLTLNYIWVMLLVRRRGRQLERNNVLLHKQEQALETARQMSVLGEMTSGFAHELNQPLSAIRHYAQGCLIRLRGQDEQHPLLPALEHIDTQAQGPIRCAISGSGSARHRAIRYFPMTGKPSTFTMLSITSGNYCACPSNSRR
jgi:signal transduction histidine kinase